MLTVTFTLITLCIHAQVMEWAIKPEYKDIVHIGRDLYKVKATNGKWGVFNISKHELTIATAYDSITPLVEGRALILDAQGQGLLGILNEEGETVGELVSSPIFFVDYPYYSNGLLALRSSQKKYGYVDSQGKSMSMRDNFNFFYVCPFDDGLAMVKTPKGKYQIIDKRGAHQYQGNVNIKFLSNPKNGVFVLATGKNRISKCRLENSDFKEVELLEKERVVDVSGAIEYHAIYCRGGNTYSFDNAFHLIEDNAPATLTPFVSRKEDSKRLRKKQEGWHFGLSYDQKDLLAPQFKSVNIYEDRLAMVTMTEGGKKGLLRLNAVGEFKVSVPQQTITFYHNHPQNIPIKVECANMMYNPTVKIVMIGTADNETFSCQGSGIINVPYFESHTQSGKSTTKSIGFDIFVDELKYGHKDIEVESVHQKGFTISIGTFPDYSNKSQQASVSVIISSNNGVPSASAKAKVNDKYYEFNGRDKISVSVPFHTQQGKVLNGSIYVSVTEDGCPSSSAQKNGTIKDYYDK